MQFPPDSLSHRRRNAQHCSSWLKARFPVETKALFGKHPSLRTPSQQRSFHDEQAKSCQLQWLAQPSSTSPRNRSTPWHDKQNNKKREATLLRSRASSSMSSKTLTTKQSARGIRTAFLAEIAPFPNDAKDHLCTVANAPTHQRDLFLFPRQDTQETSNLVKKTAVVSSYQLDTGAHHAIER